MTAEDKIKICEMIAQDMENDAKNFDGQPFNGKVVATYFGNHGAAISALANLLKTLLEDNQNLKQQKLKLEKQKHIKK